MQRGTDVQRVLSTSTPWLNQSVPLPCTVCMIAADPILKKLWESLSFLRSGIFKTTSQTSWIRCTVNLRPSCIILLGVKSWVNYALFQCLVWHCLAWEKLQLLLKTEMTHLLLFIIFHIYHAYKMIWQWKYKWLRQWAGTIKWHHKGTFMHESSNAHAHKC